MAFGNKKSDRNYDGGRIHNFCCVSDLKANYGSNNRNCYECSRNTVSTDRICNSLLQLAAVKELLLTKKSTYSQSSGLFMTEKMSLSHSLHCQGRRKEQRARGSLPLQRSSWALGSVSTVTLSSHELGDS